MRRADPTQKQAVGTGVLYNHQIVNVLQGRTAPTPSGDTAGRASTRWGRLPLPTTCHFKARDGGAAMGGIAAHGYVNGKAGAARQG